MITWAGRLLILLGAGHTLGALALTSASHAGSWFGGRLWRADEGILDMSSPMAAFWLTTGSFGVPLVVVGMLVLWLDRQGLTPPPFIAWTLGTWSVIAGVIMEPAPWIIAWVAIALLATGTHRTSRRPNQP